MVHKKSEYELQFKKLTNEIRAQIWKDNFLFRESQKRMNLSDHYWRYQLIDDVCDCDDEREMCTNRSKDLLSSDEGAARPIVYDNKEVRTLDFADTAKQSYSPQQESERPIAAEESTVPISPAALKTDSSLPDPSPTPPTAVTPCIGKHNCGDEFTIISKSKPSSQGVQGLTKNTIHSSLNPSPTRNAMRSFYSDLKQSPVFAAFGWNDADKNVGDQKTYNVRAPANQVHHSALHASGKRLKELELHLAEQLRKKRQQKSLLSLGPVNLSSIWMTEYQESFSKGQREPISRVPNRRPIVWRYT
ncbi:hypothetical protein ONE63_006312 [Megalurothrips usitatus]|uniref:Uncharacterized protein n=1 Tax=Megalurothrips usitatus TaxID=439358 RepID=A0AAV7XWD3_9NEOP|nr:hypothetical protein ONE63_006312 [Megalurothrips usitatus]